MDLGPTQPSGRPAMASIPFRLKRLYAAIFCSNTLLALALVLILTLVAPIAIKAQATTYTYTGNPFTSVNGNIGATLSNDISIAFSVATALAPNLNCVTLQTGGTGSLLSFFMTDGVNNYGLAQNTTVQCISTSATGQITQWSIGDFTAGAFPYIVSTNIPSTSNVNDSSALTTIDFASVRNNPGTWSQGPPAQVTVSMNGTWGNNVISTPFTAPNTSWQVSFTVNNSATVACSPGFWFEGAVSAVTYTLGGQSVPVGSVPGVLTFYNPSNPTSN